MKKHFLLTTSLLLSIVAAVSAQQDTVFYDAYGKRTKTRALAKRYSICIPDTSRANAVVQFTYYISGKLKKQEPMLLRLNKQVYPDKVPATLSWNNIELRNKMIKTKDGIVREWYENGRLCREVTYKNGKLNGRFLSYWEDGKVRRIDSLANDSSVGGSCFDRQGNKLTTYLPVFQKPQYPGGPKELYTFLGRNLRYPHSMQEHNISGKVIAEFTVLKDGSISSVKIKKSLCEDADAEVLRLFSIMPEWIPGSFDGEPVSVRHSLPISFRLDDDSDVFNFYVQPRQ